MSDASKRYDDVARQWVSAPGGSCDVRYGTDVVETMGKLLKSAVGRTHLCAYVVGEGVGPELEERIRRQLTDGGFKVRRMSAPAGPVARTLPALTDALGNLADAGITADDLVLGVGDVDTLSMLAQACGMWCGRVPFAAVPLDLDAMVEVATTPRMLDVGGVSRIAGISTYTKYLLCDPGVMDLSPDAETSRLGRALMVASAIAENEDTFEALWNKADAVMTGGDADVIDAALDTLKSRGHLVSSTSLSSRNSLLYGQTFARALDKLTGGTVPASTRLGEAMRFAARVSASLDAMDVDDVLMQDELLDTLSIGEFEGEVDPAELLAAMKADRFSRSTRFHLCLPHSIGRLRMTVVEDELMMENLTAWCEAHAPERD